MIWGLVITLIMTGPDSKTMNVVGTVKPQASERACEAAQAAFIAEFKRDQKPGVVLAIGCSGVTPLAVV